MSHNRPRFGCFAGTFSPSRRQMRSTRLWFTCPALDAQQGRDPPIAIAAILTGQMDDRGGEQFFIIGDVRLIALRRARLAENTAGMTFPRHHTCPELAARTTGGDQGLPVSLSGLFEDQLVHCQLSHRRA